MNVLVVGAGAVGQTYGRHLQQGGARVTFYVRDKYVETAKAGFVLYPLNGSVAPVRFEGFDLVTTAKQVAEQQRDQVWLTVSSPALSGPWLDALVDAAGDAVVILLTPGIEALARLHGLMPAERLVTGMISLIAYQAPLPGEARFEDAGIAYWFPPFGPSPFSGVHAQEVVDALTRGGQPAKQVADVSEAAAFGSALLMPLLLALESHDWRFDELRRGGALAQAADGVREAMAGLSAALGRPAPWYRNLLGPFSLGQVVWLAPKLVPLDLEVYLAYHFVKVGDQTREHVQHYIALGKEHGLPTPALEALLARIGDQPGDAYDVATQVLATRS